MLEKSPVFSSRNSKTDTHLISKSIFFDHYYFDLSIKVFMILRKSSLDIIYEYNSKYCVYKDAVEATFFKSLDAVSNPNLIKPVRANFMKIIAFFCQYFIFL